MCQILHLQLGGDTIYRVCLIIGAIDVLFSQIPSLVYEWGYMLWGITLIVADDTAPWELNVQKWWLTYTQKRVYMIQSAVKWYASHWGRLRCSWITGIYDVDYVCCVGGVVSLASLQLQSTSYKLRTWVTHGISAMFSGGGGMLLASKSSGMELNRLKLTPLGDSTLLVWALAIFVLSSVRRFVCCNSVQDDGFSRSFACMLCKQHGQTLTLPLVCTAVYSHTSTRWLITVKFLTAMLSKFWSERTSAAPRRSPLRARGWLLAAQ